MLCPFYIAAASAASATRRSFLLRCNFTDTRLSMSTPVARHLVQAFALLSPGNLSQSERGWDIANCVITAAAPCKSVLIYLHRIPTSRHLLLLQGPDPSTCASFSGTCLLQLERSRDSVKCPPPHSAATAAPSQSTVVRAEFRRRTLVVAPLVLCQVFSLRSALV